MVRRMSGVLALSLGLWISWTSSTSASEVLALIAGRNDSEQVFGAVREMRISTDEYVHTLLFSPPGVLKEKTSRNRADPSDERAERLIYRYDEGGRISGEFVQEADGESVPIRLYAYIGGQMAAEAAYHQCRTFSALHVYTYDKSDRLIEDLQYESRRLWRRVVLYDKEGLQGIRVYRNGSLFSDTWYRFDETGRLATVVSERGQPDSSGTVTTTYRYDTHGNPLITIQRDSVDASKDKIEIATYEYDGQGNWTRRTVIRAVNPLDDDKLPLERPVEVTTRDIVY